MSAEGKVNVAVIGGGPGGYVAAIRAAQLGAHVSLIEKSNLGGVCTNIGCIPTKSLLYVGGILEALEKSDKFGIKVEKYEADYTSSLTWAKSAVARLSKGVKHLLNKNGVEVVEGFARLKSQNLVDVELTGGGHRLIEAENIIIASGSHPTKPPIEGVEEDGVITSDEAFSLDHLPERVGIIGGGAIGLEFASIFKAFGAEVTVLEAMPSILPREDEEASEHLKKILERKGINIVNGVLVKKISGGWGNLELTYEEAGSSRVLSVGMVMVATGRAANIKDMGFEEVGIKVEAGRVKVDERLRTTVPNIYAVGDVANEWMLAHVAMQEGIVASENIVGLDTRIDYRFIPRCVYTLPEFAAVGLTEAQAKKAYGETAAATFPIIANGRAVTMDEREGLIKILYEKNLGQILGAQIIAPEASELIHQLAMAMKLEATLEEVAGMVHAHPTLSEINREVSLKALNRPIHI
ncbi:MAG: dihydrolipoyl dehydrogenase [Candidatus Bathyarchaeia archaeon]